MPDGKGTEKLATSDWRSLLAFFFLTFAISWGLGGLCIAVFGQPGYDIGRSTTNPLFFLFFGFGPTFAAIIMADLFGGEEEIRDLGKRSTLWRVGFKWYAIVVVGFPALSLMAAGLATLRGGSFVEYLLPQAVAGGRWYQAPYLLLALLGELLGGPINEEPGWRGYALPKMLKGLPPLSASVLLGIVWGVWHLPLFFLSGVNQFHMSFPLFVVNAVTLSILITWVFIHTRGSVFIAILMHLLFNVTANSYHLAEVTVVNSLAAAMVIVMGGLSPSARIETRGTPVTIAEQASGSD